MGLENKLIQRYNRMLEFVKKINNGYCFNQTQEEALKMFVGYETEAHEILQELGEL